MKKSLPVIAISLAIASCQKKTDTLPSPYMYISSNVLLMSSVPGTSQTVTIASNIEWKASLPSGTDWLQLDKTSGHGYDTIHVSVVSKDTTLRKAILTIKAVNIDSNLQAQVSIVQENSPVQTLWQKTLGGKSNDNIYAITAASDGGYLLAGSTTSNKSGDVGTNHGNTDVWLVKLNSNGDTVWTRTMGGSSSEEAYCAVAANDGGFVVAGYTQSSNSGDVGLSHGNRDIWIMRLKNNGDTVWTRMVGHANDDIANGIAATPDGGFVIAGYTYTNVFNQNDAYIIKIDGNGNVVWEKTFGGSVSDVALSVSVTTSGEIMVAANTESNNSGDVGTNHGKDDYWILKLTANGVKEWSKMFGGDQSDIPFSILATEDGGCIINGFSESNNNGDVGKSKGGQDLWVLRLNGSGAIVWNGLFGGSGNESSWGYGSICATADGGYVMAGYSSSSDGDVAVNQGKDDFWILKLNSNGSKVWSKTYGGLGEDMANGLIMNADGSFVVAGYINSDDGWVIKIKDH